MNVDAVAFPVLVIADDGWVQYVNKPDELRLWTRAAVMKYQKHRIVLYDSDDRVWQVEDVVPQQPLNLLTKFLAHTFHNPKIPVRIDVRSVVDSPQQVVRQALTEALNSDDDILTQDAEREDLRSSLRNSHSFHTVVAELKRRGAI